MSEQVNHPQHYGGKDNPFEAIKVIEAWRLELLNLKISTNES